VFMGQDREAIKLVPISLSSFLLLGFRLDIVYFFGPKLSRKSIFSFLTLKSDKQAPQLLKPRIFSPSAVLSGGCTTVTTGCYSTHRFVTLSAQIYFGRIF
jgi:hypothetical protein